MNTFVLIFVDRKDLLRTEVLGVYHNYRIAENDFFEYFSKMSKNDKLTKE